MNRTDLDKRYPPRSKYRIRDDAKGMDATEFAARYGELRARIDPSESKGETDENRTV